MLHVRYRHDRGFGLTIEVGTERQEPLDQRVDRVLVFQAILGTGQQPRGELSVGDRVSKTWCGAGHWLGANHVTVARYQQLRAGADEAFDREQVTRRVGAA